MKPKFNQQMQHPFSYGKLGEVTENIRTFALPFETKPYTFKMTYDYDSFNRMQQMTYPDGEVVSYRYGIDTNGGALGCRGWITFADVTPAAGTQNHRCSATTRVAPFAHLHICSFANSTYNSSPITHNSSHSFSAKERDAETGLSYFGSRYYSADLSIWLSVDPMSGKYPSISPYVYCANNPVRCVDPNGEEFETEIDLENKTITIKATYYTINDDRDILQKGIDIWNNQSGKYAYIMNDGENEIEFSIVFDLKIADGNYENISEIPAVSGSQNLFEIKDNVFVGNKEVRGYCENGNIISVSKNRNLLDLDMPRTAAHEIGHTLGCGEYPLPGDLMTSGGRGCSIGIHDIRAIMFMGGYDSWGDANLCGSGKCCDDLYVTDFMGSIIKK